MPLFAFDARTGGGQARRGTEEAMDAQALVGALRQRGWLVVNVRAAPPNLPGLLARLHRLSPSTWLPTRSVDVELSLQQLAVMLRSGLTLLAALKTVAEYARRGSMRRVWEAVAREIQQGSSLADAMAGHRCFSHLVVQLVRVGEQTGTLEQVVRRAAEALERRRQLTTQLITALAYPFIVLVAAIAVSIFMIVGVIPKLQVFLTAMGRRLPPLTQALLDVAALIQLYGPYVLGGLFALTASLTAIYLWQPGRLFIDRLLLRLPLVGGLLRLAATAQFAHGLGVLLTSGITLVEALRTVELLHGNRWVGARVAETRRSVLAGGNLAQPLDAPSVFMPMLSRMVAVGESAGSLDEVLGEVARFHENQLQAAIRRLSVIVEPVIVIVVGGIVGFVYVSFFMAMFAAAGAGGKVH